MGIVRDTWRAVLAVVVGVLLLEAAGMRRAAAPAVATPTVTTQTMQENRPQPVVVYSPPPQPERPIRRVAAAVMEMGDSVIGVFR